MFSTICNLGKRVLPLRELIRLHRNIKEGILVLASIEFCQRTIRFVLNLYPKELMYIFFGCESLPHFEGGLLRNVTGSPTCPLLPVRVNNDDTFFLEALHSSRNCSPMIEKEKLCAFKCTDRFSTQALNASMDMQFKAGFQSLPSLIVSGA